MRPLGWWEGGSWPLREVDAVKFEHHFAPKAEGVGLVKNEVEAAANGAPFPLEDLPCGVGGSSGLLGWGVARAPIGTEIRNFIFDESADKSQVMTGGGEDTISGVGPEWR